MFGAEKGKADSMDGTKLKIAIVQARFNESITDALAQACLAELEALGVSSKHIDHVRVPGALEVPVALQALAEKDEYDALIALGCIIRGETYHFEIVAGESARGLMEIGVAHAFPVGNGILTVDTEAQAWARARVSEGNKGGGAAEAALCLLRLKRRLEA